MAGRKLVVEVVADTSKLERGFKDARQEASRFGRQVESSGEKVEGALREVDHQADRTERSIGQLRVGFGTFAKGALVGAGVLGAVDAAMRGLHAAVTAGISEFSESAKAQAQTAAVLKSTGGVAGVTAKQVDDLASTMLNLTGIDDEVTKGAENILLGYTNVRNVMGRNNDIFNQATKAAADLSTRMGGNMVGAAKVLGRALNDPEKGMTRLSRAGVNFTKSQVETVKRLVETGKGLDAQRLILGEVEKRFGGAAEAAGKTLPGQLNILRETFNNVSGDLVAKVAPAFGKAVTGVTDWVKQIGAAKSVKAKFDIAVEGLQALGEKVRDLIGDAIDKAADFIAGADWGAIGSAIGRALGRIVIDSARFAARIVRAIVRAVSGIAAQVRAINWSRVGHSVERGLERLTIRALGLARTVGRAVGRALARVGDFLRTTDFHAVGERIGAALGRVAVNVRAFVQRLGNRIAAAVRSIDWGELARRLGEGVGNAIKGLADLLRGIIERIDWRSLGRELVRGIGIAIAFFVTKVIPLMVRYLASIDWIGVIKAIVRLLKAALVGAAQLLIGIGEGIGQAIWDGLGDTLTKAGKWLEKKGIELALKIIEPFSHIPRWLGGGWAQDMKANLQTSLVALNQQAAQGGAAIGNSFGASMVSSVNSWQAALDEHLAMIHANIERTRKGQAPTRTPQAVAGGAARPIVTALATPPPSFGGGGGTAAAPEFDTGAKSTADKAKSAADKLKDAADKAADARDKATQAMFDAFGLKLSKAELTKTTSDDLAVLEALLAAIRQREKVVGKTLELQQAEVDTIGQIADLRREENEKFNDWLQAYNAAGLKQSAAVDQMIAQGNRRLKEQAKTREQRRQFLAIGLTAAGEEPTIGREALLARVHKLQRQIEGTKLDTPKMRANLASWARVLADPIKKATQVTRAALDDMSKGILDKLGENDKKIDFASRKHFSSRQLVAAMGLQLTSREARRVRAVLDAMGPTLSLPGAVSPAFALEGARAGRITINGNVNVHGVSDVTGLENQLTKRRTGRSHTRRGAR